MSFTVRGRLLNMPGTSGEENCGHTNNEKPETLNREDAITEADQQSRKWQNLWESASSFHRAPCLRPSLAVGAMGGLGVGALRAFGGAGSRASFTWGCLVSGLLAGTSWYTCRRAMYARMPDESSLMQRVQAGDRDALREYHRILDERQAKNKEKFASESDGGAWYKKPK